MTEPTPSQIYRAAIRWVGDKERETDQGDIEYFLNNWRSLPGLKAYVDRQPRDLPTLTPEDPK